MMKSLRKSREYNSVYLHISSVYIYKHKKKSDDKDECVPRVKFQNMTKYDKMAKRSSYNVYVT